MIHAVIEDNAKIVKILLCQKDIDIEWEIAPSNNTYLDIKYEIFTQFLIKLCIKLHWILQEKR